MAESTTDAEPGRGADLGFTAGVAFVALALRLVVAFAWAREPVWDGHYYDFGARRIAAGLGYSDDVTIGGALAWHPWCHYPVGYSAFLGLFYRVFGHGPRVALLVNAFTGAALAAVVHRVARHATTPGRARVAGGLAALSPGLVVYAALVMTEPLAALGMLGAAWAFLALRDRGVVRAALVAGVIVGLTTLVRPQSLVCAPARRLLAGPAPAAPSQAGRGRRAGTVALVAVAAALAVVAPWTIRNCVRMDGCAFVSTNAGWNLAIGAFPRATGRFETLRAVDGCPVVTGQVQQDRCWMDEGLGWIRREPGRWLALAPKKLGFTFDHESFPIGYLAEADPAAWPEERRSFWRGVLTGSHRILLMAAALGVVAWSRRGLRSIEAVLATLMVLLLGWHGWTAGDHPFWPLAAIVPVLAAIALPGRRGEGGGILGYLALSVAAVCVTHVVFFGEDRYHLVVTPVFCILAACAFRGAGGRDQRAPDGLRTQRNPSPGTS